MFLSFLSLFIIFVSSTIDHNPLTEPTFPVIQNQGFSDDIRGKSYVRLPDRAKGIVRDDIFLISREPSGLYISFKTNSRDITVKYSVNSILGFPNMAGTGVSGVDLLAFEPIIKKWSSVFSSFSFSGNKVQYNFNNIKDGEYEFRLFLPLINQINNDLIISVNDDATFSWVPKIDYTKNKPIVAYGTSILQGIPASRPILSWTSILSRSLVNNIPFINFGFRGNAYLEPEVIDFIIENDARLYILDCMANCDQFTSEKIETLMRNAVKQIRKKRPETPILIVEHAGFSNSDIVEGRKEKIDKINKAQKNAFNSLVQEGVKGLFYMEREEYGMNFDCWTDDVHPNNYGMKLHADAYEKKIHEILG